MSSFRAGKAATECLKVAIDILTTCIFPDLDVNELIDSLATETFEVACDNVDGKSFLRRNFHCYSCN